MKKIIVASLNPVKIDTAKIGFSKMFPDETFDVQGIAVSSGVSNQPMSEIETQRGAGNRVETASCLVPDADYWVGIEGGNEETPNGMEAFAWVLVKSKEGKYGKGRSTTFFLPQKLIDLVKQGIELEKLQIWFLNRKIPNSTMEQLVF
jgi:inosine/xanthosine triphosphatase